MTRTENKNLDVTLRDSDTGISVTRKNFTPAVYLIRKNEVNRFKLHEARAIYEMLGELLELDE